MVKRTNFPRSGTTSDVGGMISASSKKNTVSDSRIEMERLTYKIKIATVNGDKLEGKGKTRVFFFRSSFLI